MAKRKKKAATPRQKLLGKRAAAYQLKLKTLRSILGGFDAQKFTTLQQSKPKTARGQAARRKAMQKVSRTFERLRPFVHRGYKLVRTGNSRHLDTLRRHAGLTKFKKLRAVPLPTAAKKVTVRFDKHGRPLIREDGLGQKLFLFPHIPRARFISGANGKRRWIDAQADAVAMLQEMLPRMPEGIYVLMSRHHFLIPTATDRENLEWQTNKLYSDYEGSPEFLGTFYGYRYMTASYEQFLHQKAAMLSERTRRKERRRVALVARAQKEILIMDRQLKSGAPLTRGQTSRRAKLKTMGEAPWEIEQREALMRKARNRKVSKRARATGRR
jgi:hypothetical protein